MPSNEIRGLTFGENGDVLVGTNGGLVVIRDGKIIRKAGAEDGIENTVFLTVEESFDGNIYAGSDGGGIYVISDEGVEVLGRDDGLTSEVIMKIIRDEDRNVMWVVTSNSIEYIKDGEVHEVSSFPYNNNYDLYYDKNDNIWIISSYGIYIVSAQDMIDDKVEDYSLFTLSRGLCVTPTTNSFSALDEIGRASCRERV